MPRHVEVEDPAAQYNTRKLAVGTVKTGDWLGVVVGETGPVMFITAEEDEEEVHRRLAAILVSRGLAFREPYFHNGSAQALADVVTFYDAAVSHRFHRAGEG